MLNQQSKDTIIISDDGSHTLHSGRYDTSYHSTHGAIQESQHVFIESGLQYWLSLNPQVEHLRIFEMGFGTGLNALLCYMLANTLQVTIEYISVEKYPIQPDIYESLNYSKILKVPNKILLQMHQSPWGKFEQYSDHFSMCKLDSGIEQMSLTDKVDIVFYDAFGPRTQPELWELPVMSIVNNIMNKDGVFVTYCAQGAFRRTLLELNMAVSKIPGPPGKREMIRAIRS